MNKIIYLLFVTLALQVSSANAVLITITQEFDPFTVTFDGVSQSSGLLTLIITSDTSNPDLNSADTARGFFAHTTTVTAPLLGLSSSPITSPVGVLDIQNDGVITLVSGFNRFGKALGSPNQVVDANTLDLTPTGPIGVTNLQLITTSGPYVTLGGTFNAGQSITGLSGTMTIGFIPEPSSLILAMLGLVTVGAWRKRG